MTFSDRRRFVGTCLLVVGVVLLSLTWVAPSGAAAQLTGSIGDRVWLDENDNGRFDSEEVGIGGVLVELFADVNLDGAPDGPVVQTAASAADGTWRFVDLPHGAYAVRLPASNWDQGGPLRGCVSSAPTTVDARDGVDGDDNGFELPAIGIIGGPIVLSPDNLDDLSLDFGCHRPVFDIALELDAGLASAPMPGDLVEVRVDVRNDGTLIAESLAVAVSLTEGLLPADPDWEVLKDGSLLRQLGLDVLRPGITASVSLQLEVASEAAQRVDAELAAVRSSAEMPNGDGFEPSVPADEAEAALIIGEVEEEQAPGEETAPSETEESPAVSATDPTEPDSAVEAASIEPARPDVPEGDDVAEPVGESPEPEVDANGADDQTPDVPRQAVSPAEVTQPPTAAAPVLALTGAEDRALVLAALMCIVAGAMLLLMEQWLRPAAIPQK